MHRLYRKPFAGTAELRSMNKFPIKSNGFTLIELMVVLTILAITATILIQSTSGLQDQGRYNQTVDRVNQIKQAIVNVTTVNGVPQVSGFVADMGRLPHCLQELLTNYYTCNGTSGSDPAWSLIGSCVGGSAPPYTTQANCLSSGGAWGGVIGPCVVGNTTTYTSKQLHFRIGYMESSKHECRLNGP